MPVEYSDLAAAVGEIGMVARGGFDADAWVDPASPIPALADGRPTRTVVVVGNVGGAMWPHFRRGERREPDPLDGWTRRELGAIAARFDAGFVHPSDRPFQPFQRWAQLADDVWPSPIGLLIHGEHGLWHAYRGALLLPTPVLGLPATGATASPCATCRDQPCRSTCPVGAFTSDGYDSVACTEHVRSDEEPRCLVTGCAARRACPVNAGGHYADDQMRFHMEAFVGMPARRRPAGPGADEQDAGER